MLEGQFKNALDMMFMGEETNGFSDQKNTTDTEECQSVQ